MFQMSRSCYFRQLQQSPSSSMTCSPQPRSPCSYPLPYQRPRLCVMLRNINILLQLSTVSMSRCPVPLPRLAPPPPPVSAVSRTPATIYVVDCRGAAPHKRPAPPPATTPPPPYDAPPPYTEAVATPTLYL